MERGRRNGRSARGPAASRGIRGFSNRGRDADIGAQMEGLAVFTGGDALLLQSAVRAMRRARQSGKAGYDPSRHAALLRLLKTTAPPVRGGAISKQQGKG